MLLHAGRITEKFAAAELPPQPRAWIGGALWLSLAFTGVRHGCLRHRLIGVIQDARAGLAVENLVGSFAAKLLVDVGAHANAAEHAGFVAHFRQSDAVMAPGDALVVVQQVFRNSSHGPLALGNIGFKLFLRRRLLGIDRLTVGLGRGLDFFEGALVGLHLTLVLFACDHALEQAVLSLGDFGLGVRNFVLEGFVGLVGLHRSGLVLVLAKLIFPLLDVEFVPLAVFEAGDQGFLGCGELLSRGGRARINLSQALWEAGH